MTPLELLIHVFFNHVHGHMARAFVHHLHAMFPGTLGQFALHLQFGELRLVIGISNAAGAQTIAD